MFSREDLDLACNFYHDWMRPLIAEKIPFMWRYFQRMELDRFALNIIRAKANEDVMRTIWWLK
jgi:hypothetical protein